MAPRTIHSNFTQPPTPETAYSLSLLQEYTHTLDALPLDLSRNFADLRELDAVLSSSMASITHKIQALTLKIEENSCSKEERHWLLTQIAEEASRLKLGGEDKIRVACIAADSLKSHATHLRMLSELIPNFDVNTLNRRTVYPHVATKSYMPAATMEGGRRKRNGGGFGSLLSGTTDSPAKRRRVGREDDGDPTMRSPRKEKVTEAVSARPRITNRRSKPDRATSPTESILSVTSHLPTLATQGQSARVGGVNGSARTSNGTTATNKRSRNNANANRNTTPHDANPNYEHTSGSHPPREYNVPPASSSHPSLPLPYNNTQNGTGRYDPARAGSVNPRLDDWPHVHVPATQLEGPGMPVARGQSHPRAPHPGLGVAPGLHAGPGPNGHSRTPPPGDRRNGDYEGTPGDVGDGGDADGGDGDGEGDDNKRYCVCNGVSYGDMIGCDDDNCDKQWFHLACVGLSKAPEGSWHCDDCKNKQRNSRRTNRGGKRRTNTNR
ncbi:Chromatin modification-related protein [Pleurotus pulmonarius]